MWGHPYFQRPWGAEQLVEPPSIKTSACFGGTAPCPFCRASWVTERTLPDQIHGESEPGLKLSELAQATNGPQSVFCPLSATSSEVGEGAVCGLWGPISAVQCQGSVVLLPSDPA